MSPKEAKEKYEDGEEYFLDSSKEIRKSIIIYKLKGSVASPMAYIQKPKWVKEEDFIKFVKSLDIYIKL